MGIVCFLSRFYLHPQTKKLYSFQTATPNKTTAMKVFQLAAIFALATSASAWPLLTQDTNVALPGVSEDAHLGIYKEGNVNFQKTLKVGGPVDLTTFQVSDVAKIYLRDEPLTIKDIHINAFDGVHLTPEWFGALSANNVNFPSFDALRAAFPGDDFEHSFPTLGDVRSHFDLPVICLPEIQVKVDISVCTDIGKRFPDFPTWSEVTHRLSDKLHHAGQKVYCLLEDIKAAFPEKRIPDASELFNSLPELDKDDILDLPQISMPSMPSLPQLPAVSVGNAGAVFAQKVGSIRGSVPSVGDVFEAKADVVEGVVDVKKDAVHTLGSAVGTVVDAKSQFAGNLLDAKHEVVGNVIDAKKDAASSFGSVLGAKSSSLRGFQLPTAEVKAKVDVQSNLGSKLNLFP
eukprot:GDKI01020559.1.p1 GENE.GDKI01020559.1~~GDKI01020559.1.p1  ORF type:complete len:402 (+),score=158.61 GDKI01020559.1:1-1206(+)